MLSFAFIDKLCKGKVEFCAIQKWRGGKCIVEECFVCKFADIVKY
jgi:hypothetical protein